jgi:hypothetical protein
MVKFSYWQTAQYLRKAKKMTASKNASKSVKISTFDTSLQTAYAKFIESAENQNIEGLNFITELNEMLENGLTQEIAKASMKETAKDVKVKPSVLASHIPAISTAAAIIDRFNAEISDHKVSAILTLAVRVNCDVKTANAKKHIKQFATIAELAEGTATKAESQARDKGEELETEIVEKAEAITLESVLDALDVYISTKSLKDLTTADLAKLNKVISKLVTVQKNTQALVK